MSTFWYGPAFGYHAGDEQPGDQPCSERPSIDHDYDGAGGWVLNEDRFKAGKQLACEAAAQKVLDDFAHSWGYDNIYTAMTYLQSSVPRFQAEAVALRGWRDQVWLQAHSILNAILAGEAAIPETEEDFIALLPAPPARPTQQEV